MTPYFGERTGLSDKMERAMGTLAPAALASCIRHEMEWVGGLYEGIPERAAWLLWHAALNSYYCALEWMLEASQEMCPAQSDAWREALRLAHIADRQLNELEARNTWQEVA